MLKMENNITGTDKISDLPDALLTHILSFLSPREAVQTCILSKRWRTTWASVPVLRFDYGNFVPEAIERTHWNWVMFVEFVRRVLKNREKSTSLDTFQFWWNNAVFNPYARHNSLCYCTDPFHIQCILLALKFKPRVFSVCASKQVLLDCTKSIFACASLQSISLENTSSCQSDVFHKLRVVNISHLKKLELDCLRVDDNFFKMLFLGCPVLEEIKLFCCHLHVSLVSSQVLNSLVLYCCYLEKKLVISTPSLLHLDIYHTESDGLSFSLENMASLVDARVQCLNVYVHDDLESPNGGLNFQNRSSKFSMPDHNLESSQAKVMGKEVSNFPNFKNLKWLQLGCWDLSNAFKSIATFLYKSPNLNKLSLEVFPNPNCSNSKQKSSEEEWRDAKSSYEKWTDAFLQHKHLQVIEIINSAKLREEIVDKLVEELSSLAKATRKS